MGKPPPKIKGPGPSIMVSHIALFFWKNSPTPVGHFPQIFAPDGPCIYGGPFNMGGSSIAGRSLECVSK
jgi:hypothetical protein